MAEMIDAHVHLPMGDGMDNRAAQRLRLLNEMRTNGISGCIVIADSETQSVIGTNEECIALFAEDANVHVIAGISPDIDYVNQLAKCEGFLADGSAIALKLFTGHEVFYLTDERLDAVYELAERYDVPVLFHSGWENAQYGDAQYAAQVAGKRPGLKLVCCHCWYPQIEKCMPLTGLKKLYFDLSSVADDPAILPEISEQVRALIAAAPDRVLFGSDYSGCSMAAHLEFVSNLGLPKGTEEKVLSGNAKTLYRIG